MATRWSSRGTRTGEFQGYEGTGKLVTWTGITIFRIGRGQIAREWSAVDGLELVAQFEANATPGPSMKPRVSRQAGTDGTSGGV